MVEIKRDYVKECVKNNIIKAQWVCSKKQLADIFTKPLPFETHKYLTNRIMNFIYTCSNICSQEITKYMERVDAVNSGEQEAVKTKGFVHKHSGGSVEIYEC